MSKMAPWRDPKKYDGPKRHTCLGCGCACTKSPWGKWCFACNVQRMERINKAMAGAARSIGDEKSARELERE